jgi:hypothetical protein
MVAGPKALRILLLHTHPLMPRCGFLLTTCTVSISLLLAFSLVLPFLLASPGPLCFVFFLVLGRWLCVILTFLLLIQSLKV